MLSVLQVSLKPVCVRASVKQVGLALKNDWALLCSVVVLCGCFVWMVVPIIVAERLVCVGCHSFVCISLAKLDLLHVDPRVHEELFKKALSHCCCLFFYPKCDAYQLEFLSCAEVIVGLLAWHCGRFFFSPCVWWSHLGLVLTATPAVHAWILLFSLYMYSLAECRICYRCWNLRMCGYLQGMCGCVCGLPINYFLRKVAKSSVQAINDVIDTARIAEALKRNQKCWDSKRMEALTGQLSR